MFYYDPTFILLIPAMIFAFYAQSKVSSAYRKFSQVRNMRGITGEQAARMILDRNGLNDISIQMVGGTLSDHYDPSRKVLRLSSRVYSEPSIASVSVAAHEAGHAIQHARHYMPLILRNAIVPVVNICSMLSWPLMLIGLVIAGTGRYTNGYLIMDIGILFFAAVVLFHAVTLPVELNASSRALDQLEEMGIIYHDERKGAKKVLSAAAMTYVAALATAVANLLRLLMIRERNQ